MSTYTVSYETDELPTNLPDGAKVERKSILPFEVKSLGDRRISVKRRDLDGTRPVRISMQNIGDCIRGTEVFAFPNKTEIRNLIEALQESIGELPEVPPGAVELPVTVETPIGRNISVERFAFGKCLTVREVESAHSDVIRAVLSRGEAETIGRALLG